MTLSNLGVRASTRRQRKTVQSANICYSHVGTHNCYSLVPRLFRCSVGRRLPEYQAQPMLTVSSSLDQVWMDHVQCNEDETTRLHRPRIKLSCSGGREMALVDVKMWRDAPYRVQQTVHTTKQMDVLSTLPSNGIAEVL